MAVEELLTYSSGWPLRLLTYPDVAMISWLKIVAATKRDPPNVLALRDYLGIRHAKLKELVTDLNELPSPPIRPESNGRRDGPGG